MALPLFEQPAGKRPANTVIAVGHEMPIGQMVRAGPKLFRITQRISEFEFHMELEKNLRDETSCCGEGVVKGIEVDPASLKLKLKPSRDMRYFYRAAYVPPEAV